MASEHTLKLKAVLDTTQVKQQLQQLRQTQGQLTGTTQSNGGLSNLNQNLNSVLSQLNRSINALKTSIDKMNIQNKSFPVATTGNVNKAFIPLNAIAKTSLQGSPNKILRGSLQQYANRVGEAKLSPLENRILELRYGANPSNQMLNLLAGSNRQKMNAMRFVQSLWGEIPPSDPIWKSLDNRNNQLMSNFKSAGQKYTPKNLKRYINDDEYAAYIDDPNYRNQVNADKKALRQQRKQMAGWAAGLAFGTVGGQVAGAFRSIGDEDVARKVEGATQIVDFGAMGAATAGVPGAAIGTVLGGLTWAINEWTASLKESINELNEWNAAIEKGRQFRKQVDEYRTNQSVSDNLESLTKSQDVQKLRAMAVTISDQRLMAVKTLEDQEYKSKIGAIDPETAVDAFKELQRTDSLLKQINKTIEAIEKNKQAEAQRIQELKLQHNKVAQGYLDNYASRTRFNENSAYINEILDGELFDALTPMGKVDLIGERLSEFRAERKLYGEKAIAAFVAAKNDNLSPEQKRKLIEEGQDWQLKENRMTPMIGSLENALGNIAMPTPPDMSNVTSIAHMGFGMGEKDDQARLDKQEQYLRDQLNVQQTIRDIIKEGTVSEATFS